MKGKGALDFVIFLCGFCAAILFSSPGVISAGPIILRQPTNQMVTAGFPFTISLQATGTGALKFQWNLTRDGYTPRTVALAETVEPMLTIPSAQSSSAGRYSVTVLDSTGETPGNAVHIRVLVYRLQPNRMLNLEIWNNLEGTAVQLQSTTNWVDWRTNLTFRNVLSGNTLFAVDRPYRIFRAIPVPYP